MASIVLKKCSSEDGTFDLVEAWRVAAWLNGGSFEQLVIACRDCWSDRSLTGMDVIVWRMHGLHVLIDYLMAG